MKKKIIVLGANGQLANEFKGLQGVYKNDFELVFFSKENLDIQNLSYHRQLFSEQSFDFCINCSAYTKVDKAEEEQELNHKINTEAVGELAKICSEFQIGLIHYSTDYVFDGKKNKSYLETDTTNPVNEYGKAKWMGEQVCLSNHSKSIVFRTSWVYSQFGNNFVKTMMKLLNEKQQIAVVSDQIGSPTYAFEIAQMTLESLKNGDIEKAWGEVFHFTNEGEISWFDFANEIKKNKKYTCSILPILTQDYPSVAQRPLYSLLSKQKFEQHFQYPIKKWKECLETCIQKIN